MNTRLNTQDLLYGYINGMFPMADPSGELYWYSPDPRAIIPIANYKISKSTKKSIRDQAFDIKINQDFEGVIKGCSKPRKGDAETWISEEIIDAYVALHHLGFAHSVEAYQENKLVGGLYGVAIGGVFFGESMFHCVPEASKIAFHFLIERLKDKGFTLLDTQFINDNVKRFGAIEISREQYMLDLALGMSQKVFFTDKGVPEWLKHQIF